MRIHDASGRADHADILVAPDRDAWIIASNAVTDTKLRDSAALSVIGRSANTVGDPADIVAGSDKDVLRRSGAIVAFGGIDSTFITDFTEAAQDAVGGILLNTATINLVYADGIPSISANLSAAVLALLALADSSVQPGDNVSVLVNDAGYITAAALPVGANPTASVGLAAVNGVAATFMRSDAAPALSQSITPTWTGVHTFNAGGGVVVTQPTAATGAALFFNGRLGGINRFRFTTDGGALTSAFRLRDDTAGADRFGISATGRAELFTDGSTSDCGLNWNADPDTGLVRAAANTLHLVAGAQTNVVITTAGVSSQAPWTFTNASTGAMLFSSASPNFVFTETDQATDEKSWLILAQSKVFRIDMLSDALGGAKGVIRANRGTGVVLTSLEFGNATDLPAHIHHGHIRITDGVTAPATVAGFASIYVDTADGDLKVKFGDGTVKTIATDT